MRTALIEGYIHELRTSFGKLRPLVGDDELRPLYNQKDFAGMVWIIQKIMKLDLRVRLGLVNRGGNNNPAWIQFTAPMPLYGTPQFRQTLVTLFLRKDYLRQVGFEQVVCAIAHELSHVLLDSVSHKLRRAEEAVDLLAMLSGFRDFYVTGTELSLTSTTSHRQGYLSQKEVVHAAHFMTYC